MKVTKSGNSENTFFGVCKLCGCEMEANGFELKNELWFQDGNKTRYGHCPECGNTVEFSPKE